MGGVLGFQERKQDDELILSPERPFGSVRIRSDDQELVTPSSVNVSVAPKFQECTN